MADIAITLTLDDSQFQTILKKVDTNTTAFGANLKKTMADSTAAVNNLTKVIGDLSGKITDLTAQISNNNQALSSQVEKLDQATSRAASMSSGVDKLVGSFTKLASAIVGASLTSFVSNAIRTASETARMAEAVGVSTAKFLELSAGAQAAGKDQDAMARAMLRMEATAQQANDGNVRLQNAYQALGISMQELHNLSPDQAFLKIAKALASMEDPGKKAELTMMLLGRDAKTVDWPSFVAGAERSAGSMGKHAQSIEDASRAYREFQKGISELGRNVLDIIDPFLKLIGSESSGILGSEAAAKLLAGTLAVMAGAAVIASIQSLVGAVSKLIPSFGGTTVAIDAATAASIKFAESQALVAAEAEVMALKATGAWKRTEAAVVELEAAYARLELMQTRIGESALVMGAATTGVFTRMATALGAFTAVLSSGGIAVAFAGIRTAALAAGAAIALAVGEFLLGAAVVTAIGVTLNAAIKWAFNVDPVMAIGESIKTLAYSIMPEFSKSIEDILVKMGLMNDQSQEAAHNLMDLEKGMSRGTRDYKPVLTTETYNPDIAKGMALMNRIELMKEENKLAVDKLNLETQLVGKSEEERRSTLAGFDAQTKTTLERIRLLGQLKVLQQENKDPNVNKSSEIAALGMELAMLNGNANAIASATANLTRQQNTQALLLQGTDEYNKILGKVAAVQEETAVAGQTNSQKAVAGIMKEEEAAINAARAKALALGIGDNDKRLIEEIEIIRQGFDQLRDATLKFAEDKQAAADKKIFHDEDLKVAKQIADIQVQISELTMSAYEKQIAAIEKLKNADIERVTKELENAKGMALNDAEKLDAINKITKAYEEQINMTKRLQEAANSFDTGFTQAWHSFADKAGTAADAGKAAFDGFANAVNGSIDALTSHSKVSFKSMIDNFILSMLNSQLKSAFGQMMGAMGSASGFSLGGLMSMAGMGGFGAAAGIGDLNKNEYGETIAGGGIGSWFSNLFHASGGNIPSGGIGIVGENGPEIVSGPASVTGASATQNLLSGQNGTTNHYYNIQAVDAKSVAQLFYENRMTMFGMTEQARRELPMRTR